MRNRLPILLTGLICLVAGYMLNGSWVTAQGHITSISATPNQKGGQDVFGGYEVVQGWPKDLASIPGHEQWTFGAGSSVFAESPDRIYAVEHGELPNIKRPMTKKLSDMGPSVFFPIGRLPWRDTTSSSPPGNGGTGQLAEEGMQAWERAGNKMGVDARWEHNILVFDGQGNLLPDTKNFMQWDAMMQRPHSVTINPYDPDKAVWFVDDHKHVIWKFSHDGSKMLARYGTFGEPGADDHHFNRPTYIDFFPNGDWVVADDYNGTRVVKFDKNGKMLAQWGQKGMNNNDTRPAYFNNVHGVGVDPKTLRIFVNDRGNHRVQVFDENGKFLDQWPFSPASNTQFLIIPADRSGIWAFEDTTAKVVKYDFEGHFLYAWGTLGDHPGGFFNMHGASVDQQGNLYIAEVGNGRLQKFRPRANANKALLVGSPVYAAWR